MHKFVKAMQALAAVITAAVLAMLTAAGVALAACAWVLHSADLLFEAAAWRAALGGPAPGLIITYWVVAAILFVGYTETALVKIAARRKILEFQVYTRH